MKAGVILVVDDDGDVRDTIRHGLEALGYRTAEAADGRGAIAYVRKHRPLAVILDFLMPATDPTEILKEMLQAIPGTPIIVTTGYANEQRLRAEIGEDIAILHKPFRIADLAAVIRSAIQEA